MVVAVFEHQLVVPVATTTGGGSTRRGAEFDAPRIGAIGIARTRPNEGSQRRPPREPERSFLGSLPADRFDTDYVESRRVHNVVPFITVDGVRHSVPPEVLGQLVEIRRPVDSDRWMAGHRDHRSRVQGPWCSALLRAHGEGRFDDSPVASRAEVQR